MSDFVPTHRLTEEASLKMITAGVASMAVRMGDFTNIPGGFPIVVDGQVIGAVAAGGAKIEEDVLVAKAALAALETASKS
jgi:uncharacterized protein GlcG (DUF336 family)